MINKKLKKIVLLEFKRTCDYSESYFQDMWEVVEKQYVPILTGLRVLSTDQEWEVEVVPPVIGQCSVQDSMNTKNFSADTGDTRLNPQVDRHSCWGEVFRSVFPSPPGVTIDQR